jgi:hypothetical protein
MNRDAALKIDALLLGIRYSLSSAQHYMRPYLSEEDYKKYKYAIARSTGELIDISNDLYTKFPDIFPDELK